MPFTVRPWTKADREPYKDSTVHYNRHDVGEYMEDLVDTWHASAALNNVSLYDFLGLMEDEVGPWAGKGIVPDRIIEMFKSGEY